MNFVKTPEFLVLREDGSQFFSSLQLDDEKINEAKNQKNDNSVLLKVLPLKHAHILK